MVKQWYVVLNSGGGGTYLSIAVPGFIDAELWFTERTKRLLKWLRCIDYHLFKLSAVWHYFTDLETVRHLEKYLDNNVMNWLCKDVAAVLYRKAVSLVARDHSWCKLVRVHDVSAVPEGSNYVVWAVKPNVDDRHPYSQKVSFYNYARLLMCSTCVELKQEELLDAVKSLMAYVKMLPS